jgi:hypothetical protein
MALTLEDLLPIDQQLRSVQPHERVAFAIDIMYRHGYGQLPVTGANGEFQGQVITFESVIRAIQSFRTEAGALLVRDAAQRVRSYAADADLLATRDDIHRDKRFEQLLSRKNDFEQIVGEPMEWERLDNRQACRIAVYSKAQILTDAESPTLLEWAAKKATSFYKAFEPQFPREKSPL